ncbi:phosphatidate cytidylyltransferase [uncultured Desulfobacter sp.]|uniref:phosphatidate cytidylyltransferase n=1 Tax=uncultured Desulfobacter sp. TaxID=240139 RepID=UPI002AA7F240|nr:phosphatidate cytidylyltransferase [uncultured Desulfobacter sp.]
MMQHFKRWLTALILIPILLWAIIKGSILVFAALVSLVSILAIHEYFDIICANDIDTISKTTRLISYSACTALIMGACIGSWPILFFILALDMMALCVFVLARFSSVTHIFDLVARQVLGIVYIPLSLALLVFIRDANAGALWVIWLLIVCFANDTGALYVGTFKGKHKLSPNISPNKTIEGALGGLVIALAAGLVFSLMFFQDFYLALRSIPCAICIAAAGQIGDLFESAMKRVGHIKDSGKILPGHGGMLDRIDGVLLAIPVFYFFKVFVL